MVDIYLPSAVYCFQGGWFYNEHDGNWMQKMDTHGAWVVGIWHLWNITLLKRTKKSRKTIRVDFLCERKNQIIYCMGPLGSVSVMPAPTCLCHR